MKFAEIEKEVQALKSDPHGLYHFTMGAAENASDTIHVDKAADENDFDHLAMSSLENLLAFTDNIFAREWFAAHGVTW